MTGISLFWHHTNKLSWVILWVFTPFSADVSEVPTISIFRVTIYLGVCYSNLEGRVYTYVGRLEGIMGNQSYGTRTRKRRKFL
jgi:hypothetical protein